MESLVQLCSIPTRNKMKGINQKVDLLATITATLNSSSPAAVVDVLKRLFIRQITEHSVLLLEEKKLGLQRKIAEQFAPPHNIPPRTSLAVHYLTYKNEYDNGMRSFAIGLGLIDEKTRDVELDRLPFLGIGTFEVFCQSKMDAKRLQDEEERAAMIRRALELKVKVQPKMDGRTTCSNGHTMDTSRVVHLNCKNGQDGTWFWIRRDSKDKICENCKAISDFSGTICSIDKSFVSSETYGSERLP